MDRSYWIRWVSRMVPICWICRIIQICPMLRICRMVRICSMLRMDQLIKESIVPILGHRGGASLKKPSPRKNSTADTQLSILRLRRLSQRRSDDKQMNDEACEPAHPHETVQENTVVKSSLLTCSQQITVPARYRVSPPTM